MAFWRTASFFSSSATTNSNVSPSVDDQGTRQDTIERLCDRVQLSTRPEDRRDAVKALRAVSKKWKLEVATQSMTILAGILQGDRADLELIQLALETLSNIMTFEENNPDEQPNLPQDITVQFTELFIKTKENVHAALDLIEETDFNLRRSAIRFLTIILKNCTKTLQDRILESGPMGVSKLVDLLHDEREVIRNDALLLLQTLTQSNPNIQKIVAFENGFERLFEILTSEGGCQGTVVVEDCLVVLLNLLKNNPSNQSFFRESSYIRRLADFFQLSSIGEQRWSAQKNSNIHHLLQIIRTLVSPTNSNQNLLACQRTISQCGLLHRLCVMLTLSTIPADVLAETLNTIADVIRGHHENQQFFGSVMNTNGDVPQPVLTSLLYTLVAGEKQSFPLRIAILYCFQCYLYKNDYGRSLVIQTLLPQTENANQNQLTLGHLLIIGYLSKDPVASWCSSIAFAHLINDHQQFKEALLQVVLTVDQNQTKPKSLMEISVDLLENSSSSFQTRIAILMFLCMWIANCPLAVQSFLAIPNSVSYLISQICAPTVHDDREMFLQSICSFAFGLCFIFNNNQISSFSSESLERIIQKRIGMELFQEKLETLSKSDSYAKTLQRPQLKIGKVSEMLLDYEFARLYKILEGSITRSLTTKNKDEQQQNKSNEAALLTQYYEFIQQQNQQIQWYREQEKVYQEERQTNLKKVQELEQALQEIRDQYTLLKQTTEARPSDDTYRQYYDQQQAEIDYYKNMVTYLQQQQQYYLQTQSVENGFEKLNITPPVPIIDESIQTDPISPVTLTSNDSEEKLNERLRLQSEEIARLQLETNILQEKLTNEKRKVAILETLQSQFQELVEEKSHLNDEYQQLNTSHQQLVREQGELLVLCSTYEDQLKQCRQTMQNAHLTIPEFLLEIDKVD